MILAYSCRANKTVVAEGKVGLKEINVLQAKDVMTKNVITIHPDATLEEAIHRLIEKGISGMPVIEESGKMVGIISEKDILNFFAFSRDLRNIKVKEVMTENVISFPPEIAVEKIALSIGLNKFRRAPILDGDILVGIISRRDIIRVALRISEVGSEE
jgi:CBS domain-containing protein